MIFAFNSLVDLKDCVEKIEKKDESSGRSKHFKACKATLWTVDDNGVDVAERHFYTLIFGSSNGNVAVGEDDRGFDDLAAQFPSIPSETIESVWKAQQTWDACFGVLSSLVSEHQSLRVSSCHSFLDNVMWPALAVGETNPDNEWSVLELDASLASLALEIEKSQLAEGWQILDTAEIPSVQEVESKLSFKDVVLRGEAAAAAMEEQMPALVPLTRSRAAWQPKIEVKAANKRRVDKLYMGQAPPKEELCDEGMVLEVIDLRLLHFIIVTVIRL